MGEEPTPEKIRSFILGVPQIVPERWCMECRICCRFPEPRQVQTPVWSGREAEWARSASGRTDWFEKDPEAPSLHPRLVPCGSGWRCPAFVEETNRCSIHEVKPLDCRLYPFVLAGIPGGKPVLAVDTKCPYVQAHGSDPKMLEYAAALARYLENPLGLGYLKGNPRIVGRFWPEYVSVAALPGLATEDGIHPEEGPPAQPPHPDLKPFCSGELGLLREAISRRERRSSGGVPANLLGWSDLIRLWWTPLEGTLCLFAQQAGGFTLPLPPLGEAGRLLPAVRQAWEILSGLNRGGGVSRIEGLEEEDRRLLQPLRKEGFLIREGGAEYLYRREDLTALRGNRYRSQRWSVNRFKKRHTYRIRPFEDTDLAACLMLFTRWAIRRQQELPTPEARRLIRDNLFFHRRIMMEHRSLGLLGRVVEVEGRIQGYTFGAPVSAQVFCVLLEIADRSFHGLGQTLFQEFCKELEDYPWINAMGDEGLEGLRQAKKGYRPAAMISTWSLVKKER